MSIFNLLVGSTAQQSAGGSGGGGGGGTDVTPDSMTGDYSNISSLSTGVGSTEDAEVSGIDTTINLYYELSGTSGGGIVTYSYRINSGSWIPLTQGSGNTFSVTNLDTVGWRVVTTEFTTQSGTITMKNGSDGDATLDTFTYAVRVI
jgi:hypothetical protein